MITSSGVDTGTHMVFCPRCLARNGSGHNPCPTVGPGGSCPGCGWVWGTPAVDPTERIAVALERIASVLTTLRDALVGDGRHTQEPAPPGPFSHDHRGVLPGS